MDLEQNTETTSVGVFCPNYAHNRVGSYYRVRALPIYSFISHPWTFHTQDGITLLMMAVQQERVDIVKTLLQRGADPYAENEVPPVQKCDGCYC